ncbi:UNVERIFIED_CONTAM: hypothetical protein Sradi_0899000 [Sesamum radiatum]|uniref:Reverse transcriptase/retrotransposon-derived protein RNase H-like domain-containing protein n=1 Tax=Sesamum radiatum TaxID=300843 RepID=A0AAW2V2V5_SESRA
MKNGVSFEWDEACRNAFRSIKSHLMKPPVLVAPVPERPLILYIAAKKCLGALLVQENDEGKESVLYYLSRMMTPNELKYSPIEKICLVLIFAIQKLKHYFQAHIIRLVSKANPLKYVILKPVLFDRLARWYLQLQQFEIVYDPQKAVKGQVFKDFLADHPIPAEWELSNDLPDENVLVIERLIGCLGDVEIEHVPRKDNKQADGHGDDDEDNAHVPICKSWVVPPIFDDDDEGEEEEELHIIEVLDIEREDWRQPLIDCLKCQACQFHANFIHQPPESLHLTVASWPFDAWGLDVVGSLTKSSAGHLYILAATDYFSKWAEAVPLKEVKKENVADFITFNIKNFIF